MLTQTLLLPTLSTDADDRGSGRFDIRSISTPPIFIHIVTLIKRSTGEEISFNVETFSDRFSDVMLAINIHRAAHRLFGYEFFEALSCNEPPLLKPESLAVLKL